MPERVIEYNGRRISVPSDFTDADIAEVLAAQDRELETATEHPLARFGKAVTQDLSRMGSGVAGMASAALRPPGEGEQMAAAAGPVGLALLRGVRAVQQAGGPVSVLKGMAGEVGQTIAHPIQRFNEAPLSTIGDVSMVAAPATGLLRGMGRRMGSKALDMYTSALKVPDVIRNRNPGVDINRVGLTRGIPVSGEGIERGASAIRTLENDLGPAIDQSQSTIRLTRRSMPNTVQEVAEARRLSAADPVKAVEAPRRLDQFLNDPNISDPILGLQGRIIGRSAKDLTPRQVQDMKVRLGQMMESRFGKDNATLPDVEMNQAIRSDLRGAIEQAVPEVGPLNAELGPRYALQDALERRVPVFQRQNQLPMRAAVGSWVLGNVGGGAGKLAGAIAGAAVDNPAYLSKAAISMYQASERLKRLPQTAAKLAPYATMDTFARTLEGQTPTGQEARVRGQIATDAVKEWLNQPSHVLLPVHEQDRAIQQLLSDVSLLLGGTAETTLSKARSPRLLKDLMASHATERP